MREPRALGCANCGPATRHVFVRFEASTHAVWEWWKCAFCGRERIK